MVRGSLCPGQRWLGSFKLCDSSQLPGETLLVPRAHLEERGRVPPVQRDQRELPRPRVRVLARSEVNITTIRGQSLPLQNTAGRRGQLCK